MKRTDKMKDSASVENDCGSSIPSWVALLDSPTFRGQLESKPGSATQNDQSLNVSSRDMDHEPWYMSPFYGQPVADYSTHTSLSNPAFEIKSPQPSSEHGQSSRQFQNDCDEPVSHQPPVHDHTQFSALHNSFYPYVLDEKSSGRYISSKDDTMCTHYDSVSLAQQTAKSGTVPDEHMTTVSNDQFHLYGAEDYPADSYTVQHSRPPCGGCSRMVTSLIVVMSLAIVGLAVALTISVLTKKDLQDPHKHSSEIPVVQALVSMKILNKNYTENMSDVTSRDFYQVAKPYSEQLDLLFLNSPLTSVYRGNQIMSLQQGSIKVDAVLTFQDTGLVESSVDVENVINSTSLAQNWTVGDAREMGDFVVCRHCATVTLRRTTLATLPRKPILLEDEMRETTTKWNYVINKEMMTEGALHRQDHSTKQTSHFTYEPRVSVSSSKPFLEDGHFIVTCDATNVVQWLTLTLELFSDTALPPTPVLLVTLKRNSTARPAVLEKFQSRIQAFEDFSSNDVSLVVNVTNVNCQDRGEYLCQVTTLDGLDYEGSGRVDMQVLPGIPNIRATENNRSWEAPHLFTCSANLGYPPGMIVLSVARTDSSVVTHINSTVKFNGEGCESKAEVSISAFDPLVLRNASRIICQVFSYHLDNEIGSKQHMAVYDIVLPKKLEIRTKSTFIDDGLAAIKCRLLNVKSWRELSLLRVLSSTETAEVVSIFPNGRVDWSDYYLHHRSMIVVNISDSKASFDIFIYSLKCADDGTYACAVRASENMTSPHANLTVTAKPSKPTLTIPQNMTEDDIRRSPITCRAKVGHPAGNLVLKILKPNETEFQYVDFNEQTTVPYSCMMEIHGTYYPSRDLVINASTVSCQVLPHKPLKGVSDDDLTVNGMVTFIPAGYCSGKGDKNVSHPTNCRYYVTCRENAIISIDALCDEGFCFNETSNDCWISTDYYETAEKRGVCFPDKEYVTFHDPHVCTTYIQCDRGRDIIQHCPTGMIFASGMECTPDVRESRCYKDLNAEQNVVTNSTYIVSR